MLRNLWPAAFSLAVAGAISCSSALAQSVPPNGPGSCDAPAQNAGAADSSQQKPYQNYASDYPAPEIQAVPVALARAVATRQEQDVMLAELHSTVDRIREDFNYSPEMIAATHQQNEAYEAYDAARDRVLDRLSADPTYRAMISLVVTLKQKLDEQRPAAKPTEEDLERLLATATLKLSYASAASAMEVAALSADSDVMQTRGQLLLVANKINAMRADFERQIHRNPEFLEARRNLDNARINRLVADAFLTGAVDARSIALDYAYYVHRFDQYSYSPISYPVYPYAYGYGYGGSQPITIGVVPTNTPSYPPILR
jgi:hypothetical protein